MINNLFDLLSLDAGVKADYLATALGISERSMSRMLLEELNKGRVRRQMLKIAPRGRTYLYFIAQPSKVVFPQIRCTQYRAAQPSGSVPERVQRLWRGND